MRRRDFVIDTSSILASFVFGFAGEQKAAPGTILVANVPDFTMELLADGRSVKKYEISVGRPETSTPLGEYSILTKANWDSQFAGTWMRFKENGEFGGWGIHGYPHREFNGHAVSQGCIRMLPEEAEELKKSVSVGTPLINVYEILIPGEEFLELCSDIYGRVKNPEDKISLLMTDRGLRLDKPKLADKLNEWADKTQKYRITQKALYTKYIKNLPPDQMHPNLIKDNPEIMEYLDIMKNNSKTYLRINKIVS
ncbi:MAG: L,D-transpeptidase [Candidatus Aenigmatarchaeota archaeon]